MIVLRRISPSLLTRSRVSNFSRHPRTREHERRPLPRPRSPPFGWPPLPPAARSPRAAAAARAVPASAHAAMRPGSRYRASCACRKPPAAVAAPVPQLVVKAGHQRRGRRIIDLPQAADHVRAAGEVEGTLQTLHTFAADGAQLAQATLAGRATRTTASPPAAIPPAASPVTRPPAAGASWPRPEPGRCSSAANAGRVPAAASFAPAGNPRPHAAAAAGAAPRAGPAR